MREEESEIVQTSARTWGKHFQRTGNACQVPWDYDTLKKVTSDKTRMELRLRRRRPGESLSALHQKFRRLVALAHPTLPQEA